MSNEVWVPVDGYEGLYEVSSLGRVRSLDKLIDGFNGYGTFSYVKAGTVLKPLRKKSGYYQVNLYDEHGNMKSKAVHRIVLESFTGYHDLQVNHKNFDKGDNRLENLEWMTCVDNIHYSKKPRPVVCFDPATNVVVKVYPMMVQIKDDGHDLGAVYHCCNKDDGWYTHHGFGWRYANVE